MFRRLVITVATMLAMAVVSGLVAEPAQAGRGGGGRGGGGGAYSHSGGGGGGVHPSHASGSLHSGSLHSGRSGVHALSRHGTRHTALSHPRSTHNLTHNAKLNKSLTHNAKLNKSLTHNALGTHHRFFGRRVFAVWFGPIFWPYAFYDLFDYVF
jgi:hypothetical protein